MTHRNVDGIAKIPKNDRGSYYFVSLETWRRINERQWTIININ